MALADGRHGAVGRDVEEAPWAVKIVHRVWCLEAGSVLKARVEEEGVWFGVGEERVDLRKRCSGEKGFVLRKEKRPRRFK